MDISEFQAIGDKLTKALISGDFVLYRSLMVLPLSVTPRDGKPYQMQNDEALREDFDLYHRIIRLHGVTDIFRDVQGVDLIAPDRAVVKMLTHILQRANRLVHPFPSRFHLIRQVQDWRITRIESSEGHIHWTLGRGNVTDGHFKDKDDDAEA